MSQAERLLDWYNNSDVVSTSIVVPINTRVELCTNNPNRIYLLLSNEFNAGPFSWILEGPNCKASIDYSGSDTSLLHLELQIEKHFKMTQLGWAIIQTGGGTIVNVIEVLYRG